MTNTVWLHLHKASRVIKFLETEGRMVVVRSWREYRSYCLVGTEFQFVKFKKFWGWVVRTVAQLCL
jgi:hypothetical protein